MKQRLTTAFSQFKNNNHKGEYKQPPASALLMQRLQGNSDNDNPNIPSDPIYSNVLDEFVLDTSKLG